MAKAVRRRKHQDASSSPPSPSAWMPKLPEAFHVAVELALRPGGKRCSPLAASCLPAAQQLLLERGSSLSLGPLAVGTFNACLDSIAGVVGADPGSGAAAVQCLEALLARSAAPMLQQQQQRETTAARADTDTPHKHTARKASAGKRAPRGREELNGHKPVAMSDASPCLPLPDWVSYAVLFRAMAHAELDGAGLRRGVMMVRQVVRGQRPLSGHDGERDMTCGGGCSCRCGQV